MMIQVNGKRRRIASVKFWVVCRCFTQQPTIECGVIHHRDGAHIIKDKRRLPVIYTAGDGGTQGYYEARAYVYGFEQAKEDAQVVTAGQITEPELREEETG